MEGNCHPAKGTRTASDSFCVHRKHRKHTLTNPGIFEDTSRTEIRTWSNPQRGHTWLTFDPVIQTPFALHAAYSSPIQLWCVQAGGANARCMENPTLEGINHSGRTCTDAGRTGQLLNRCGLEI